MQLKNSYWTFLMKSEGKLEKFYPNFFQGVTQFGHILVELETLLSSLSTNVVGDIDKKKKLCEIIQ